MGRIWVEQIEKGTAKTGNAFLKVLCISEDKKKRQLYLWDACDLFEESFNNGSRCFECSFGGDANFPKISSFESTMGDATEFFTFIYQSDEHAVKVFEALKSQIHDVFYCSLIDVLFNLPGPKDLQNNYQTIADAFCIIPAAKAYHHDFRYGLIRHTHEVMSFVSRVSESDLFKDSIDRECLLTGAFLHDVGKTFEYSFDGVNHAEYGTGLEINQIYLGSHLYKGAELVEVAYQKMIEQDENYKKDVYRLKVEHLKHVIMAHHLQRDWGSIPKEPQTLEAMLVFLGDYFSAAFGKVQSIDWSGLSAQSLLGATSKFNTFFGFTQLLNHVTNPDVAETL